MERADRMGKDRWSETSGTTEQEEDKGFSGKRILRPTQALLCIFRKGKDISYQESILCNRNYNGS